MVEVFGRVQNTEVTNGELVTIFRIPALSSRVARERARVNARLKGYSNISIGESEQAGDTDIPGARVYDVRVTSDA